VPIPAVRVTRENDRPVRPERDFVLYWMIGARRSTHNFALDHARDIAAGLNKPLLVLEPLRAGYPWASDRLHTFVVEGMRDNAAAFSKAGITHYAYVEPAPGDGRGLLAALARHACAVVTDDIPGFFQPRMVKAAAQKIDVALHSVDANGLYPIGATEKTFPTAYVFRRHLQKELPAHLAERPASTLVRSKLEAARVPQEVLRRWPAADLSDVPRLVASLPIDHTVTAVNTQGGSAAARKLVDAFLDKRLARYATERSEPDADAASGLSPYLHFGHIGAHAVFDALAKHEQWDPSRAGGIKSGHKEGFWGMSAAAESFLDELVTWRELGFHTAKKIPAFDQYASLPPWARASLDKHAGDGRAHSYTLEELAGSRTHDPIWNAAQRQLVREGTMHNYLRMLWGKKVLEWSRSPQQALAHLVELNNKYALDGRDPNSYSGILWCFGRYDRPWGPERPIFGVIRYMSSDNTKRKFSLTRYLATYAAQPPLL
jgi:deoxyribodipyrimidine photo-lyase